MATKLTGDGLASFLARVRARQISRGVSTAKHYLESFSQCLGGTCPLTLIGKGSGPAEWAKAVKDADSRLVYHDPDMVIKETAFDLALRDPLASGMPEKAAGVFESILTTTKRDRDRDVLESSGAVVDPHGPLLLQHMPFELVGKHLKVLKRTKKAVLEKNAVIDTAVGQDVMTFIEFGAFRMSHGFTPLEIELMDESDPDGGFHIKSFEVLERSLVSVPANTDSVITAYSRREKSIRTPLLKEWSGAMYRRRPVQGRGLPENMSPVTYLSDRARLLQSNATIGVDDLEKLCPACAKMAKSHGWKELKVATLVKEMPAQMLDGLCERLEDEEHPWQACMDSTFGDFDPDDKEAFCNWLKHECGLAGDKGGRRVMTKETSSFDVSAESLPASSLFYEWVSKHLGCPVKKISRKTVHIPVVRMGGVLTGFAKMVEDCVLVDTRNLVSSSESPPQYETVRLNSKAAKTFLVNGMSFYRGGETTADFVVEFERTWSGVYVTICCKTEDAERCHAIMDAAQLYARENPVLRGEAFSLMGEFIETTKETWDDIYLTDKNKKALRSAVERMKAKGATCPNRGVILMGEPGTGKTMSGRIIRNSLEAAFIWVSAKDLQHTGSAAGVSLAFEMARELSPAVIFFEDIDNWLYDTTVDLIKTEMDGIGRSSGILTILTTNYPERLPDALIDRPGRFHEVLHITLPDEKSRGEMLAKWMPELGMNAEAMSDVVSKTDGYSGAHLFELCYVAGVMRDEHGVEPLVAIGDVLQKIDEQRQLIAGMRANAGSAVYRRSLDTAFAEFRKSFRSIAWKAGDKMMLCPECGGEITWECTECEAAYTGEKAASQQSRQDGECHCQAGKALRTIQKAGRVLSQRNISVLQEAIDDLAAVVEMEDVSRAAKSLIRSAVTRLQGVLEAAQPAGEEAEKAATLDEFLRAALADYAATGRFENLASAKTALDKVLVGVQNREQYDAGEAAMQSLLGT